VTAFFPILGHQTLDPDQESGSAIRKNAGSGSVSGSALYQCGSETLHDLSFQNKINETKMWDTHTKSFCILLFL
jgi:hypothetical protein